LADISALTGFSRSLLERELAARRMPRPDLRKGRRMVWRPSTIRRWLGEEEP
jgi:predicted DNA-binding transcriptional regulator AlpA